MFPNLLEQIEKESLLAIIITLPKQLTEQSALNEELRDQVVKNSAERGKLLGFDNLKKLRTGILRRMIGLRSGGQKGQQEFSLQLVSHADPMEQYRIARRLYTATNLKDNVSEEHERNEDYDASPPRRIISAHQANSAPITNIEAKVSSPLTRPSRYNTVFG